MAEAELISRRNVACVAAALSFGISLEDGSTVADDWGLRRAAFTTASPVAASTHGICSAVVSSGHLNSQRYWQPADFL